MITTLDDVERISKKHASKAPLIAEEIEFRRPGLSQLESARLRRELIGLPDDYLSLAMTWRFDAISIGLFNLQPPAFGQSGHLVDRLLSANSELNPNLATLKSFQVLEIATYEGDMLGIGAEVTSRSGHIFWFAPSLDLNPRARYVAATFEDLLKAAMELEDFRVDGRVGPTSIAQYLQTIRGYIPDLALGDWQIFAEEALQLA